MRSRSSSGTAARVAMAGLSAVVVAELAAVALRSSHSSSTAQGFIVGTSASAAPAVSTTPAVSRSTVAPATPPTSAALTTSTTSVLNGTGKITYTLAAPAAVTVSAHDDSWLEIRSAASAPILWVGTLSAGASRTYQSPVWIRTGNPAAVTVTAGGSTLTVPTTKGPIDVIVAASS